jgi:hypothetical protein
MNQGLLAMARSAQPTEEDWRVCTDAVNLLETLVEMGHMQDASGLLKDAVDALAKAGQRRFAGGPLRLDAQGLQAVKWALVDYTAALESLSHRVMVMAHRATAKRISDVQSGRMKPHDVLVVKI